MATDSTLKDRARKLVARIRPVLDNRPLVIVALVVLAALPAMIGIEDLSWETDQPAELPKTRARQLDRDHLAWANSPESSTANSKINWDAHTDFELSDAPAPVDFDCMIEPWEQIEIRSAVIGRIDAIHVERADIIEKGELLVELDADLASAELQLAEKRSTMTASLKAFEARQSLGLKRGERASELFAQNAIALDAKDEIMTEQEIAKYDLLDARDQLSLAHLQLAREQARYEQHRIRSPVPGIVANRLMSTGEVVDEETILQIAQIDPLRVEVILPATEFGSIESGMKAAVIPEIPGDEVVIATVRVVDRIIDSASGTFGAELELPNAAHAIPGGLRCRVQFMDAPDSPEELAQAELDEPPAQ